jgi:heat shock protein HslJ
MLDEMADRRPRGLFLLVTLAFLLVACGSDGDGDDGDADASSRLEGREFLATSVEGRTLVSGTQIRVSFDDDQIGASAGCNSLGAPYEVVDGRLVVKGSGMATTDMGCDPQRHAQDAWLATLLQSKPRLDLDADSLTVTAADAVLHLLDRAVADPDRPLVGTRWRVDTVLRDGSASSALDAPPVTLELTDDGALVATSPQCTSARVDVEIDEARGALTFGDVVVDAIGCPPPWEETLEVLRRGEARYSIEAARLTITAGDIGVAAVSD